MILEENRTASYIRSLYTGNTELLDTIEQEALRDYVPIIRVETQSLLKLLLKQKETPADSGTGNGCWIFSIAHVRICTI